MLLIFFLSLLLFGLVAQWKRVCLLSRRLWVRPPPGSFFYVDAFYFVFFSFCSFLFLIFLILIFLCSYFLFFSLLLFFSVLPYFSFLFLCCESKSGRVVQGGSLRYCSLRRRGFEPHLLHFSFFYSPFPIYYYLVTFFFLFMDGLLA